jgi:hypothetical protein
VDIDFNDDFEMAPKISYMGRLGNPENVTIVMIPTPP